MKKITVLFTLVLVSLMIFNSCSKESTEMGEKIIMSSGQENFWCDDEYCYWIDPELLDPPILQEPVYGPMNLKKEYSETTQPDGTVIMRLVCKDSGRDCGTIREPDANGVLKHVGYYATQ